jgi:predicted nucleic-acid-binding Zn-ribbon protein
MTTSTCVKCGGTRFEMKAAEPKDSAYKQMFIQCSSCGGVAGVTEYYDAGVLAKDLQNKIATLQEAVQRIESQIQQIVSRLR